jgi:transposase
MRAFSHFVFEDSYGRPGKAIKKGNVEALVKFSRLAFLTPVQGFPSFAALNAHLELRCLARLGERSGQHLAVEFSAENWR